MKVMIILLLIIIGSCLANYTIEPFQYGNGEDYYPHTFVSNDCPCLSCIDQTCASPYKT